jgi:hypothetical protein
MRGLNASFARKNFPPTGKDPRRNLGKPLDARSPLRDTERRLLARSRSLWHCSDFVRHREVSCRVSGRRVRTVRDPELTFSAPIEGSFDELDARSHVGDQCHPILDVATAEDPNRFVRPGRLSVVLGLAWFIARISLPAYMIRDNRYGGICGFSVADHH